MRNDGSGLEDHRITEEQERMVIYARRLLSTLGGHAADALAEDFGLNALLKEKSSIDIANEKQKAKGEEEQPQDSVERLFNFMKSEQELKEGQEEQECQCALCQMKKGKKAHSLKVIMAMIGDDAERDLAEELANCPHAYQTSMVIKTFYRALAMGYVLGRDERKIKSGQYDEQLAQLDRMNALKEIDKELMVSEAVMGATSKNPPRLPGPLGAMLGDQLSMAFEERRDVIKLLKRFIENGIIPVKQVREIADRCQSEMLFSVFGGSKINLVSKIEEELTAKEDELKRLKQALEG